MKRKLNVNRKKCLKCNISNQFWCYTSSNLFLKSNPISYPFNLAYIWRSYLDVLKRILPKKMYLKSEIFYKDPSRGHQFKGPLATPHLLLLDRMIIEEIISHVAINACFPLSGRPYLLTNFIVVAWWSWGGNTAASTTVHIWRWYRDSFT